MIQRCLALGLLVAWSVAPVPAGAELLRLVDSKVSVRLIGLPLPVIPQVSPIEIEVSSGGAFTLPADLFVGSVQLTSFLFTGSSLFSSLNATLTAQSPLFVGSTGAGSGVMAGSGVLGVLGGLVNLVVPMQLGGSGTFVPATPAAALLVTVEAFPGWTTGAVQVTGVETEFSTSVTAMATGSDARTAGLRGTMSLVSASRVLTNSAGNTPLFATLTLRFAPEPMPLIAFGLAAVGFAVMSWRRRS
jgi:hypothetical protein